MADDGSQQRKPDFRTAIADVKALATVLVLNKESQVNLWLARALVAIVVLALAILVILLVYPHPWTGFGPVKLKENVQPAKTLWDWLDLLIVPFVLAIGGYLFNRSANKATEDAAERRAQDETLRAYLDGMSQLLTDNERPLHRARPRDNLSAVARARTLTVLPRLDGARKGSVVRFLYESGLITKGKCVISLRGADLSEAFLRDIRLIEIALSRTNLRGAHLVNAQLTRADLSGADLSEADLSYADLIEADLGIPSPTHDDLGAAQLSTHSGVLHSMVEADLRGANLAYVNLRDAKRWSEEQLRKARSLEGATMPDGQVLKDSNLKPNGPTFEDWLERLQSRREDEQNSDPS
jgi:hypothetical protein